MARPFKILLGHNVLVRGDQNLEPLLVEKAVLTHRRGELSLDTDNTFALIEGHPGNITRQIDNHLTKA